ncbi:nitrogen fixation protein FixH [Tepidamorphus gemmatus]|uniref:Nitrogen fixation protein FixH n=1 Tax=Tepidamorphus gemmatus TaxID=747076 RepID=A0A4R3MD00_9HYPH|nr:FixH family protein [Tepidamorphus gemmatus]TCT09375.1 nitrogen fixation protein FixH [Tepidamorphus gemmatus]
MSSNRSATAGWQVTGRTVLIGILAFFGVVIAVNAALIYLAVSSHTGVVTGSSYRAGNGWQAEIEAAQAQLARNWRVEAVIDRTGDEASVEVNVRDRNGAPVTGLAVATLLRSPIREANDIEITLTETETGRYLGKVAAIAPGNWTLLIDAAEAGVRVFHSESRLFVR